MERAPRLERNELGRNRAGRKGASIRMERRTGGSVPLVRIDRPPLATPAWAIVGWTRRAP